MRYLQGDEAQRAECEVQTFRSSGPGAITSAAAKRRSGCTISRPGSSSCVNGNEASFETARSRSPS